MATTSHSALSNSRTGVLGRLNSQTALALVRLTIGAMFVSVFFENLGKGLYTPSGYAGLIHGYIQDGSAPDVWKSVMGFVANHASLAAPFQAITEISFGILLLLGLFARLVALLAAGYLASLWISEWGTAWIWELLVPVLASFALAVGGAGRTWGVDSFLARKRPASLWW